ncbi:hypothetical protein Taro_049534 [Colocasia esculenta]|uniref:Uncharacterized protein n=1 Tax=Colocasia esculenta TaxID=4460 RepID=A0A843XB11_COLES|nr:hypothetical protein [Colocasia esculenta]
MSRIGYKCTRSSSLQASEKDHKKQKQGYLSTDTKDLSTDLTGVVCQKTHSSQMLHLSTDDRSAVDRSHSPDIRTSVVYIKEHICRQMNFDCRQISQS